MFNYFDYILWGIVFISFITDLRSRKILNIVTFPSVIFALILNTMSDQYFPGLMFSLKGLLLGIAIFWIPFTLGGLGAGDLKLLGVIGAFKGLTFVLWTGLYTAVFGGLISLIIMMVNRDTLNKTINFIKKLIFSFAYHLKFDSQKEISGKAFPYTMAIILGMIATYYLK